VGERITRQQWRTHLESGSGLQMRRQEREAGVDERSVRRSVGRRVQRAVEQRGGAPKERFGEREEARQRRQKHGEAVLRRRPHGFVVDQLRRFGVVEHGGARFALLLRL
jgi:hypothetical protein